MKSHAILPLCGLLLSAFLPAQAGETGKSRFEVLGTRIEFLDAGQSTGSSFASYRISFDGGESWTPKEAVEPELELIYRRFDPLAGEPFVPAFLRADGASRLYIVQYKTSELEAYRIRMRNLGAEVHTHLPWQASLMRMTAA